MLTKARFLFSVLSLFATVAAHGALMPSYRMESLVLLSDVVVLCEEGDIRSRFVRLETDSTEVWTVVACRALRTFKGEMKPGTGFSVEYGPEFRRHLRGQGGYTVHDSAARKTWRIEPRLIPAGRALLFLKKPDKVGPYRVVTAKLIQPEEGVLQFGQFESNPGPLVLAPQMPENIQLAPAGSYGEPELVRDLLLALEASATLKQPVPIAPERQ